jgi:hypothetical protein
MWPTAAKVACLVKDEGELSPGSPAPRDPREMDYLLRRVPEVALLPEFADLRFSIEAPLPGSARMHAERIVKLADSAYLERLRYALDLLVERAAGEHNGGLGFVAASLRHFVNSLPAEHHPLVVALYFLSVSGGDLGPESLDGLASQMDDYESGLG